VLRLALLLEILLEQRHGITQRGVLVQVFRRGGLE
jgi:hypothetical protein